jgi:hypothetical protein
MQAPYCYSNDEIIIFGHTLVSLYCPNGQAVTRRRILGKQVINLPQGDKWCPYRAVNGVAEA